MNDAPVFRVPAHGLHEALGARFRRVAGWEVPVAYDGPEVERGRLAGSVGVADVSAATKVEVRGATDGAPPGGVGARFSSGRTLLLGAPGSAAELLAAAGAEALDVTHAYAGFVLGGPGLAELLPVLSALDLRALGEGEAVATTLLGVRGICLRRWPGLWCFVGTEHGRYAWGALLELARDAGGGPVGREALGEGPW